MVHYFGIQVRNDFYKQWLHHLCYHGGQVHGALCTQGVYSPPRMILSWRPGTSHVPAMAQMSAFSSFINSAKSSACFYTDQALRVHILIHFFTMFSSTTVFLATLLFVSRSSFILGCSAFAVFVSNVLCF